MNSLCWAPYELGLSLAAASSDGSLSVLTYQPDGSWHADKVRRLRACMWQGAPGPRRRLLLATPLRLAAALASGVLAALLPPANPRLAGPPAAGRRPSRGLHGSVMGPCCPQGLLGVLPAPRAACAAPRLLGLRQLREGVDLQRAVAAVAAGRRGADGAHGCEERSLCPAAALHPSRGASPLPTALPACSACCVQPPAAALQIGCGMWRGRPTWAYP